jgi:hypothetical protein
LRVLLRQFLNPLICVLSAAAAVSLPSEKWSNAAFTFGALPINAVTGPGQEYSAERTTSALEEPVTSNIRVLRQGGAYEIDARNLVPGTWRNQGHSAGAHRGHVRSNGCARYWESSQLALPTGVMRIAFSLRLVMELHQLVSLRLEPDRDAN